MMVTTPVAGAAELPLWEAGTAWTLGKSQNMVEAEE